MRHLRTARFLIPNAWLRQVDISTSLRTGMRGVTELMWLRNLSRSDEKPLSTRLRIRTFCKGCPARLAPT